MKKALVVTTAALLVSVVALAFTPEGEQAYITYNANMTLQARNPAKAGDAIMRRIMELDGIVQNYSLYDDADQASMTIILAAERYSYVLEVAGEHGTVKNTHFSSNDVRYQELNIKVQIEDIDTTLVVIDRISKELGTSSASLSEIRRQLMQQRASLQAQLYRVRESIGKVMVSITIERSR
jgi:hypothetical protein